VDALLARIELLDGPVNAWITVCAQQARAAAHESARRFAAGTPLGALDGIPIGLKDNIATAGVRTTCGSRILREYVPDRDAEIVVRLKQAGAIILGKTNMLEFAYGNVHPDVGQCNNPWLTSRTAGGSSGGSAAAVAAGMVPITIGTDTGGSVRIPAAYCGIIGLKPTFGRVSHEGVFPLSWSQDHVGQMGRTAEDVLALLDAVGPDVQGPEDDRFSIRDLRFGVVRQHLGDDLRPGVRAAFERAVATISGAGAQVVDVALPSWEHAEAAHGLVLSPEAATIHADWLRSRPEEYAPVTRLQLELGSLIPAAAYLKGQRSRTQIARETKGVLAQVDVLVSPTVGFVSPETDPSMGTELGALEGLRTGPQCLIGMPAVSVPCGTAEDGLPAAIQFSADWGSDRRLLRIAGAFLALTGWEALPPDPLRA
jgi:aspartyl-tRNA(Asn)/glutamyl-tRNA(Gln) amidotransferase subunit A